MQQGPLQKNCLATLMLKTSSFIIWRHPSAPRLKDKQLLLLTMLWRARSTKLRTRSYIDMVLRNSHHEIRRPKPNFGTCRWWEWRVKLNFVYSVIKFSRRSFRHRSVSLCWCLSMRPHAKTESWWLRTMASILRWCCGGFWPELGSKKKFALPSTRLCCHSG